MCGSAVLKYISFEKKRKKIRPLLKTDALNLQHFRKNVNVNTKHIIKKYFL